MGKETGLYRVRQVGKGFAVVQQVEPTSDEGYGQQIVGIFPTCQEAKQRREELTSGLGRDAGAAEQAGFENHAR